MRFSLWFCFYSSVPVFFFLLCSISFPGLKAKHKAENLVVEGPWGDGTLFQTLTSTTEVVTYTRHQKAYYISYPLPLSFSMTFLATLILSHFSFSVCMCK